jgi:hypothetical protein
MLTKWPLLQYLNYYRILYRKIWYSIFADFLIYTQSAVCLLREVRSNKSAFEIYDKERVYYGSHQDSHRG